MSTLSFVPKKTAADDVRDSVISVLKEVLREAESGNINTVVVIARQPDGTCWDRASGVDGFAEMIGRLEILKAQWIAQHISP